MRRARFVLPALFMLACEPSSQVSTRGQAAQAEAPPQRSPPEPELAPAEPVDEGPPGIPGLLLERLPTEAEGSLALPEGAETVEPQAAVALGEGLALVGHARSPGAPEHPGQTWRWLAFVPEAGEGQGTKLDSGSITAALPDGKGGALLAGQLASGPEARAWFGALDARGKLGRAHELDSEAPAELSAILFGHGPEERALVLGELGGQGWVASLDARGALRWHSELSGSGPTQIHAAARLPGERDELLAVGTRTLTGLHSVAWWSTIPDSGGPEAEIEQGNIAIEGADPRRVLEAIVFLPHSGFLALGRAGRESGPGHDQVIAVGFDHSGQPTWSRVLDHLRATQVYAGAVNPELPGIANFVLRVPIAGGEDRSALAWLDISPGVDGIHVPRQLAGTIGWASAGFVAGRERPAILAYRPSEAGLDWKVLPLETSYRVGAPK